VPLISFEKKLAVELQSSLCTRNHALQQERNPTCVPFTSHKGTHRRRDRGQPRATESASDSVPAAAPPAPPSPPLTEASEVMGPPSLLLLLLLLALPVFVSHSRVRVRYMRRGMPEGEELLWV